MWYVVDVQTNLVNLEVLGIVVAALSHNRIAVRHLGGFKLVSVGPFNYQTEVS